MIYNFELQFCFSRKRTGTNALKEGILIDIKGLTGKKSERGKRKSARDDFRFVISFDVNLIPIIMTINGVKREMKKRQAN
jgi:hypothetical protein